MEKIIEVSFEKFVLIKNGLMLFYWVPSEMNVNCGDRIVFAETLYGEPTGFTVGASVVDLAPADIIVKGYTVFAFYVDENGERRNVPLSSLCEIYDLYLRAARERDGFISELEDLRKEKAS